MIKLFIFMGAVIWAMCMLQIALPDAHAWQVRDDHDAHALRFEAAKGTGVSKEVKQQLCSLFTGESDCLSHFSVTGINAHSAGVSSKWKF